MCYRYESGSPDVIGLHSQLVLRLADTTPVEASTGENLGESWFNPNRAITGKANRTLAYDTARTTTTAPVDEETMTSGELARVGSRSVA